MRLGLGMRPHDDAGAVANRRGAVGRRMVRGMIPMAEEGLARETGGVRRRR
jgi:hypothetical protein